MSYKQKMLVLVLSSQLCFSTSTVATAIPLNAESNQYQFMPNDPHHQLFSPKGTGPFPAVIMLHASGGVEEANLKWAALLKKHGYVVYVIDSFTPRNYKDRKSIGWERATTAQFDDIQEAYRYLATLKTVDVRRIGLLGFSMGGYNVLRAMQTNIAFKAAASFYGICKMMPNNTVIKGPVHIFIGNNDDRATTTACEEWIARNRDSGQPLAITHYKHAQHGFDNPSFPPLKELSDETGAKYHIGYNQRAEKQSERDLLAYFRRYLKN